MLHRLNDLDDFAIHATDGDIGRTKDFYFDDKQWVIRYLVVETGTWLSSRKVLLSPMSIKHVNREDKTLTVSISKEQVKHSPDIDTQKPVSRQHEMDYLNYYGYPFYWENSGLWGYYPMPLMAASGVRALVPQPDESINVPDMFGDGDSTKHREYDHHLRSSGAVTGYNMEATDGELGHLQGMLIDTESWAIRYLIVNTSNWWLGHLVLIAPQWIKEVSWDNEKMYVDMTQQQIKDAPIFDPALPFSREHEEGIHRHYERNGYWEDDSHNLTSAP
jgi:hypothetical protein